MKRNNHCPESGQAILELALAMIALMALMLIALFIGGSGIANVRTLLEARADAEVAAMTGRAGGDGRAVGSWSYDGAVEFSALDRVNHGGGGSGAMNWGRQGLESGIYSEGLPGNRYYDYRGPAEVDVLALDSLLVDRPVDFLEAAQLVEGRADRSGSGADNLFESRWDGETRRGFRQGFRRLFHYRIDNLRLSSQPANKAYFPSMNR